MIQRRSYECLHSSSAIGFVSCARPRARVRGQTEADTQTGRVADLRRRPREHALFSARSDQQRQLQQARGRVAVQDRRARPAPGVQLQVDAADGRRRRLLHGRHAARRRRARRRAPARCCGCTARTKASAANRRRGNCRAAGSPTGPQRRRARAHRLRHARLSDGRARREDRRPGRRASATKGIVDLKKENDQPIDPITGEIGLHATPIIAKDVIVVGAAHLPGGAPKSRIHEKGFIRGYDARTGKRLWIFHTIPLAGEFGNDTWEKDSWSYTGNAGVWAQMTIDEELGMVYLPVELPTGDYYGGHRPGNNLFGESLVALDLKTGQRKWHFQMVHHGIWDMDIPCAPILVDITVDGRAIKAIGAADQAGLDLRVRSRDRQAGLADRRASGREGHRAGRVVFADAAVRHQAAAVRAPGRVDRRSDRLHAGAARGSGEAGRRATRSDRSSRRRS